MPTDRKNTTSEFCFGPDDTNIVKAIAVFLLLAHHLFTQTTADIWRFASAIPFVSQNALVAFSQTAKVCVTIFVFLSAFGMTRKYRAIEGERRLTGGEFTAISVKRYIKLMCGFWFVWLIALVARGIGTPLTEIYESGLGSISFWGKLAVDAFGLSFLFGTPTLNLTWWYMTLAQVLIVVLPIMYELYKNVGALILPLAFLLPIVTARADLFAYYAFAAACGVVLAEGDILDRMKTGSRLKCIAPGAVAVILYAVAGKVFRFSDYMAAPLYSAIAVAITLFCASLLSGTLPGRALAFVGKHSSNIFMTHTLIFAYSLQGFFYSLRYSELIWLALMASSLALSIVIEWVKRVTRYSGLAEMLQMKLGAFFGRLAEQK